MAKLSPKLLDFLEKRLGLTKSSPDTLDEKRTRLREQINYLVDVLYPRLEKGEDKHIDADINVTFNSMVRTLEGTVRKIEGWKKQSPHYWIYKRTELEVEAEMSDPLRYANIPNELSTGERYKLRSEQLPGRAFDEFKFRDDLLLHLLQRYLKAAKRTQADDKVIRDSSTHKARNKKTLTYEVLANFLADLWCELKGEYPKTSRESAFHRFVNMIYQELLSLPERSSTSLKKDLANHARRENIKI